jgi:hypothetical protein
VIHRRENENWDFSIPRPGTSARQLYYLISIYLLARNAKTFLSTLLLGLLADINARPIHVVQLSLMPALSDLLFPLLNNLSNSRPGSLDAEIAIAFGLISTIIGLLGIFTGYLALRPMTSQSSEQLPLVKLALLW